MIIPCFNDGPLAAEAVESALEADAAEVELVVIDDGSTEPETLAALDQMRRQTFG